MNKRKSTGREERNDMRVAEYADTLRRLYRELEASQGEERSSIGLAEVKLRLFLSLLREPTGSHRTGDTHAGGNA